MGRRRAYDASDRRHVTALTLVRTYTMASVKKLDLERAKKVAQTVIRDVGTVVHGALVFIGDRMGLFKAMMDAGPLTVEELASKTELSARYIREWLGAMAAAHYVDYDLSADTY